MVDSQSQFCYKFRILLTHHSESILYHLIRKITLRSCCIYIYIKNKTILIYNFDTPTTLLDRKIVQREKMK